MYDSQVLVATHSPVALGMLEPEQVLCFAKDETGATDIVSGDRASGTSGLETGRARSRRLVRLRHSQLGAHAMKDLVIMVADKNAQFALTGALNRPEAMGIRRIAIRVPRSRRP